MQTNNFVDNETNEKFYITKYKTIFRDNKWINVDNSGNELKNPKNGNILVCIPKNGIPNILKGNNKETLNKMLKKRSSEHFNKEIKDVKHELNRKLNDKTN